LADKSKHESITEILMRTLADYIEDSCDGIRQSIIGFPEPNLRLKKPSVSIYSPSMNFAAYARPYVCEQGETSDSKAQINYVVGNFETTLKIDLWAGNKEELDDLFEEIFQALQPEIIPTGLTLELEKYFNQKALFTYSTHQRANSEDNSRKDTWRITFDILTTCNAIRSKKEFIIENTQIDVSLNNDDTIQEH